LFIDSHSSIIDLFMHSLIIDGLVHPSILIHLSVVCRVRCGQLCRAFSLKHADKVSGMLVAVNCFSHLQSNCLIISEHTFWYSLYMTT